MYCDFNGWACNPVPGPQDAQLRVAIIVTSETDVIDGQDFGRCELKASFGRISHIAQPPRNHKWWHYNSLHPSGIEIIFLNSLIIFKLMSVTDGWCTSRQIILRSLDLTNENLTLVQAFTLTSVDRNPRSHTVSLSNKEIECQKLSHSCIH